MGLTGLPAAGVLGLSILAIAVPGLAQSGATTADLSGVVVDQLKAIVPGVTRGFRHRQASPSSASAAGRTTSP
jgi:hypothetical protein